MSALGYTMSGGLCKDYVGSCAPERSAGMARRG